MKVFISWSGEISHQTAIAFKEWLPLIMPTLKPFVSSEDIYKGNHWAMDISKELSESDYGIICLVPDNLKEPWLNFEAGALSKSINNSRIIPFLLNLEPNVVTGPLSQFQFAKYDKNEVKKIICSLNEANKSDSLSKESIDKNFKDHWPKLELKLNEIKKHKNPFFEIFGEDILSPNNFHLIYAQLKLKSNIEVEWPYCKPGEENKNGFKISRPISSCEIRAAAYLSEAIGREVKTNVSISSDVDMKAKLDTSFIAFGGPLSNFKTRDVIYNDANDLIRFNNKEFTCASSGEPVNIIDSGDGYDYGLILKINSLEFHNRTWITCAGIGEWGTSGAAWYLANKWNEIHSFSGNLPFAFIVRVKEYQDQSAYPVYKRKSNGGLEDGVRVAMEPKCTLSQIAF